MNRVFARLAAASAGLVAPAVLAVGAMAATCPHQVPHQVPAPCRPHDPVVVTVQHPDPGGPCRHIHHSHPGHPGYPGHRNHHRRLTGLGDLARVSQRPGLRSQYRVRQRVGVRLRSGWQRQSEHRRVAGLGHRSRRGQPARLRRQH